MGSDHHDDTVAEVLVRMGAVLLHEQTVERILELVTELTDRVLTSADAVSVTLLRDGDAYTPNASEPVARDLDDTQYREGTGPCLDALRTGSAVNSSLLDDDARSRWPAFTAAAQEKGIAGIVSLPLAVGQRTLGALNTYSERPGPFGEQEVATASLLAQQAAAVLTNAMAFAQSLEQNEQLRAALDTRDLIGQAKGILMERQGCDADAAFDILRRASQRSNRKLRDVAAEIVSARATRGEM
jgi:GAF domain-containing protein